MARRGGPRTGLRFRPVGRDSCCAASPASPPCIPFPSTPDCRRHRGQRSESMTHHARVLRCRLLTASGLGLFLGMTTRSLLPLPGATVAPSLNIAACAMLIRSSRGTARSACGLWPAVVVAPGRGGVSAFAFLPSAAVFGRLFCGFCGAWQRQGRRETCQRAAGQRRRRRHTLGNLAAGILAAAGLAACSKRL